MPETTIAPAEDALYEVINGKYVEKPMGAFQTMFASALASYLSYPGGAKRLGRIVTEMLFLLNAAGLKRRPDVAFVSYERWPRQTPVPDAEAWDVVPDLAVEVLSPSNTAIETVKKLEDYFRAGVRQVWVIYVEQRLFYSYKSLSDIRILRPGDELDGGDVLPGVRIAVRALFEDEATNA
jgi:Uma2 family endonuclease